MSGNSRSDWFPPEETPWRRAPEGGFPVVVGFHLLDPVHSRGG